MARRLLLSSKSREQKKLAPRLPVRKAGFRERLGDRRLSRSGQPVQPEHPFVLFVRQPLLDL